MKKGNFASIAIMAFLSFVWGTTWVAIKYSLEGFPPFLGAMARFIVAACCLLIYALWKRIPLRLPAGAYRHVVSSSVLLYLLDYGLIYWGEQYLYAGVTAIFFATFPLFTGVVANFVFRNEAFSRRKFVGLLLGFAGVTVIFYEQLLITRFDSIVILATAAIILSALAAALSLVIVKKYLSNAATIPMTLHQMLLGILALGSFGLFQGELERVEISITALVAVFYLGILGSALAFVLYYSLLKKMSAVSLSYIIYITPVVAVVVGWILLGEKASLQTGFGAAVIFAGIALTQKDQTGKLIKKWNSRKSRTKPLPTSRPFP